MRRRGFLAGAGGAALGFGGWTSHALAQETVPAPAAAPIAAAAPARAAAFGFEDIAAIARDTAGREFVPTTVPLAGAFEKLSYDQFRAIRFRRDHDPFGTAGRFGIDLMSPGLLFKDRIEINLVTPDGVRPLPFDPRAFDFDPALFPGPIDLDTVGEMGWSGFRIRAPLNRPDFLDEVAVFQGASYFRAVARGTTYGLSARGLALDTGAPGGEEFPLFRAFWLHLPAPDARSVTIHALLDSPSVAGGYEMVLTPGADTVVATRAALFPRRRLTGAGIAPLTSMFWYSAADREGIDDYRAGVHDSDGLQMMTGQGRRLWRSLGNPPRLQLSDFQDESPRGFGLIQRERAFDEYRDAEARYETRPSAWVEPHGDWGPGAIGLVEIPVENEFHDNIVSFWRPGHPLEAGQRHDFGYDLTFAALPPERSPVALVRRTMVGKSINNPHARSYLIDFDLAPFAGVTPRIAITTSAGEIGHNYTKTLPEEGILRLAFDFLPGGAALADLMASLTAPDGQVLAETWMGRWVRP